MIYNRTAALLWAKLRKNLAHLSPRMPWVAELLPHAKSQPRQVNVEQQQQALPIVVPVGPGVCAEDRVHRLFHLPDVLAGAPRERLLRDRLLGAARAPEGALRGRVRPAPGVQFIRPVRPGQDGDEGVL